MNEAAINLFHQADAARARGDKSAARKLTQASLQVDPDITGSWFNLASDFHNEGDRDAAVACLRRIFEVVPNEPRTLTNIGWNLIGLARHREAVTYLEMAITSDPTASLPWCNLSLAYNALGEGEKAIQAARESVRLDPPSHHNRMTLSFALMQAGYWQEGLKEYESRFHYKLPEFLNYPIPKWDGDPVDLLFIPAEQGFGDMLQFGRYIPLAAKRCKRVMVCIAHELESLINAQPKPANVTFVTMPAAIPKDASAFVPVMSLPVALGLKDSEIPTAECSWFPKPTIRQTLNPVNRKKIGIIWGGSPEQDNDMFRSANVNAMLGLYQAPNIQLYSLQVGDRAKEIRGLNPLVIDLSPKIRDFSDTAQFMLQMDAVVSVCTSTAHLAGCLGMPTHVILPCHGQHFVWGHGHTDTPWYPTMKLYHQERLHDWQKPIEEVSTALGG